MTFTEEEGLTLILSQHEADLAGLRYDLVTESPLSITTICSCPLARPIGQSASSKTWPANTNSLPTRGPYGS